MKKLPEVGMDEFRTEPDGDDVEVIKARPDGKVCFVGRFPTEEHACETLDRTPNAERRTLSAKRRDASAHEATAHWD
jgi:hypothetical protein